MAKISVITITNGNVENTQLGMLWFAASTYYGTKLDALTSLSDQLIKFYLNEWQIDRPCSDSEAHNFEKFKYCSNCGKPLKESVIAYGFDDWFLRLPMSPLDNMGGFDDYGPWSTSEGLDRILEYPSALLDINQDGNVYILHAIANYVKLEQSHYEDFSKYIKEEYQVPWKFSEFETHLEKL